MIFIPISLFENEELSYVTQSLGMWICYLCQHSSSGEIRMTLEELEGYVGHPLTNGDIYRLGYAHLIEYVQNRLYWHIRLQKFRKEEEN